MTQLDTTPAIAQPLIRYHFMLAHHIHTIAQAEEECLRDAR